MAEQFKIGDTVQLKSGGPEMTVTDIQDSVSSQRQIKIIICTWFDKGKYDSHAFDSEALTKAG